MLRYMPLHFALLAAMAGSACAGDEPRKSAPPLRLAAAFDKLRALAPGERLQHVMKLAGDENPFVAVAKGDLAATVVERGAIESADSFDVICKIKARKDGAPTSTIKWLIDDGTMVKKGDKLAVLDDSALREELYIAAVKVQEAEVALKRAVESAAAAVREHAIEVRLAEIAVKQAELELRNAPKAASKELLELRLEAARLIVERAATRAKAAKIQLEAEVLARQITARQETARLREIESAIAQCVLTAPADGMVVYFVPESGRFGRNAALVEVGAQVREGQKLMRVTQLKEFALATRVHEAMISAIRPGQAVEVRVDAMPRAVLQGKVSHVSPKAAIADWRNDDVKVYPVTIALTDVPAGLKPGMSAELRIDTGTRKGVLQVPLKAIVTIGGQRFCFVKVGTELVERKVALGHVGAEAVEIRGGLQEKDLVVADLIGLLGK